MYINHFLFFLTLKSFELKCIIFFMISNYACIYFFQRWTLNPQANIKSQPVDILLFWKEDTKQ